MAELCLHCKHPLPPGRLYCPHCGSYVGPEHTKQQTQGTKDRNRFPFLTEWKAMWSLPMRRIHLLHILHLGGMALGIVIILSAAIWSLWKLTAAQVPVSAFLPRSSTMLYMEFDLNPYRRQVRAWNELFPDNAHILSLAHWKIDAQNLLHAVSDADMSAFGAHAGIALITNDDTVEKIVIVEMKDRETAEKLISTDADTHYKMEGRYLIIATSSEVIHTIGTDLPDRLIDSIVYQNARGYAGGNGIASVYVVPSAVYTSLLESHDLPWMYDLRYTLFASLLHHTSAVLADIHADDDAIEIRSVSIPTEEGAATVSSVTDPSLARFITPSHSIVFIGSGLGRGLAKTREDLELSSLSLSVPLELLQNEVRARTSLNLEEDMAPFLDNPYLISLGTDLHSPGVVMELPPSESNTLIEHIHTLLSGYAPYLHPLTETFTLSDGSTAQELLVNPNASVIDGSETVDAYSISTIAVSGAPFTIYYSYYDTKLFLALQKEDILELLRMHATEPIIELSDTGNSTVIQTEPLIQLLASLTVPQDETSADDDSNIVSPWQVILNRSQPLINLFSFITDESTVSWQATKHTTRLHLNSLPALSD